MQTRGHQLHHGSQAKGLRTELSDYDESLLLDRSYVHMPADGCVHCVDSILPVFG